VVPAGFQARQLPIPRANEAPVPGYVNGLRLPTAIDFAPDGRMFVGDWFGRVKVFGSVNDITPTLSVDVVDEVHSFGDRGLLGMKLDPEFGTGGHNFIYLAYAYDQALGSATPPKPEFVDGGDNCKNEPPYTDCVISGRVVRIALNPATGVAAAGAVEPPQQVLVQSWCQQFNSHSVGDLEFDADGALLVSGGEGANYAETDYGQFSNPCGDPVDEGGSMRAQDVQTPAPHDQTEYSGSVIRIDPATGEPVSGNPLLASPDVRARRILAYGFRNPFRIELRPGTGELYVGDVGQNDWEELDRLTLGGSAPNFGWPCFEGANGANQVAPAWETLAAAGHAPLCQNLYNAPGLVTAPVFAYGHSNGNPPPAGLVFGGDECDPSPGGAFSGLAFYEAAGVPAEAAFPAPYQGALFMGDAARGCIWVAAAGVGGKPDFATVANFATTGISPVDVVQGPDGALYAPNFYDDSIEQIRYVGTNAPPTAAIDASKVDGPIGGGFQVKFDASGSEDPEGDTIHYAWDLDGDGDFDDGADEPTAEETYNSPDNVIVKAMTSDALGRSDVATVTIYPGDEGPPVPVIEAPAASLEWAVGDTIHYQGSATDPDGDTPDLKWTISIRHCPSACHTHPYTEPEDASGSFTAPPHEYPSHLRFELTATDDRGRSVTTAPLDVFPRLVDLGLASEPTGIPVSLDGEPAAAGPFKLIAGSSAIAFAPATATVGGVPYVFSSWSDGGEASHPITALQSTTLVARYSPVLTAIPAPPEEPPPVSKVKLTIASQPSGVKIQAGRVRRRAPFTLRVRKGVTVALRAPGSVTRGGHRLALRGWRVKGTLKKGASLRAVARGNARYVAVYGAGR
jgi:glucose/arabinose dehydrogenase